MFSHLHKSKTGTSSSPGTSSIVSSESSSPRVQSVPGSPKEASKQTKKQVMGHRKKHRREESEIRSTSGISFSSDDEVVTLYNMDRVQVVGYCINSVSNNFGCL